MVFGAFSSANAQEKRTKTIHDSSIRKVRASLILSSAAAALVLLLFVSSHTPHEGSFIWTSFANAEATGGVRQNEVVGQHAAQTDNSAPKTPQEHADDPKRQSSGEATVQQEQQRRPPNQMDAAAAEEQIRRQEEEAQRHRIEMQQQQQESERQQRETLAQHQQQQSQHDEAVRVQLAQQHLMAQQHRKRLARQQEQLAQQGGGGGETGDHQQHHNAHDYQQYTHQHRHQSGHAPPHDASPQNSVEINTPQQPKQDDGANAKKLYPPIPTNLQEVHASAAAALTVTYSPDPFRKVRLRIPLEIVSVHGCKENSHPVRRSTSQCLFDGSVRITIRGRGFQAALGGSASRGASAWLVESGYVGNVTKPIAPNAVGSEGARSSDGEGGAAVPILRIPCVDLSLSPHLPDLIAFCTLPSLSATEEDLTTDPAKVERARLLSRVFRKSKGSHNTFHFQLFSGDLTQTALLRDAVTMSKKAVSAPAIPVDMRSRQPPSSETNGRQTREGKDNNNKDNEDEGDNDDGPDEENGEEGAILDETLQAAVKAGNWKALGIGGLDKQFSELFRRAFSTRAPKSSALVSAIGIQHVKGVILHGPPGTGKTLAARMLAKLLKAKDVAIINGPELMSKYVGDSEKNIRELFAPAMTEHKKLKDKAGLYVIVFDEVDAILRPRGANGEEGGSKALYDGVTTQLLSYMDGIDSAPNVLIIGLTNRLEALDKALLRPGRFEVQIRLHLPDKTGREEILWVHTQKLRDHKYLASDVNLAAIAEDTISFSGADLAGTVRSAISYALERHAKIHQLREAEGGAGSDVVGHDEDIDSSCDGGLIGAMAAGKTCKTSTKRSSSPTDRDRLIREAFGAGESEGEEGVNPNTPRNPFAFRVTSADFRRAVKEILSARSSGSGLSSYMGRGVVQYSKSVGAILRNINKMAQALLKTSGSSGTLSSSTIRSTRSSGLGASSPRVARYAITGPRGSGKTAVAALAARNARFASSFVISPEALIGLSPSEKIKKITDIFDVAVHTPSAVVLIDDCDAIIESIGGKGNLNIVVALRSLIHRDLTRVATKEDSNDNRLLIITTSTSEEVFQHLGLYQFDGQAMLADLSRGAAANVLHSYHVFAGSQTQEEAQRSKALSVEAARNLPPRVPIKRLMFFIDQARAQNNVVVPSADAVPLADLSEHPLFPSLWTDEVDPEEEEALKSAATKLGKNTEEALAKAARTSAADIFDPFAPKAGEKSAEAIVEHSTEASYVTVGQFQSILAQFHSFYSNTNGNFMVEELTPV